MLRVTSEGYGLVANSAGISEQVDKTVIIASGNQSPVVGECHIVNMGSVSS